MPTTMQSGQRDQQSAIISVAISVFLITFFTLAAIVLFVYVLRNTQQQANAEEKGWILDASLPY